MQECIFFVVGAGVLPAGLGPGMAGVVPKEALRCR